MAAHPERNKSSHLQYPAPHHGGVLVVIFLLQVWSLVFMMSNFLYDGDAQIYLQASYPPVETPISPIINAMDVITPIAVAICTFKSSQFLTKA